MKGLESIAQLVAAPQADVVPAKSADKKPKAKVWLNIGYTAPNGEFVALPLGCPLDTQSKLDVPKTGGADFINKRIAQNALLEMVKAAGYEVAPGETRMLNLEIQIRATKPEEDAPATPPANPYLINLTL